MKDPAEHLNEPLKYLLDGASIITVFATIMEALPAVAALLSIVWTCIRIYETKTVQGWIGAVEKVAKDDSNAK